MVDVLKSNHIDRLKRGVCSNQGGISYAEVLNNMERISDHCMNISTHLHQRLHNEDLDSHKSDVFDEGTDEYKAMKVYYEKQYIDPIRLPQA